jgi:hypothetical protein
MRWPGWQEGGTAFKSQVQQNFVVLRDMWHLDAQHLHDMQQTTSGGPNLKRRLGGSGGGRFATP